jgi:choline kinase
VNSVDTAIILAAGRGNRLKEMSLERPKPMTIVNDTTIIDNLIHYLIEAGLKRIVIVVGYMADKLESHISERFKDRIDLIFINNQLYDKTNNIYSLWMARDYLMHGFYLFEADVFCHRSLIEKFITYPGENIILAGPFQPQMNGTVVEINSDSIVGKMYLKKDQDDNFDYSAMYKTINFYRIGRTFVEQFLLAKLNDYINKGDVNYYYERIIQEAVDKGIPFNGLVIKNEKWWEIDTHDDLRIAEDMFSRQS